MVLLLEFSLKSVREIFVNVVDACFCLFCFVCCVFLSTLSSVQSCVISVTHLSGHPALQRL